MVRGPKFLKKKDHQFENLKQIRVIRQTAKDLRARELSLHKARKDFMHEFGSEKKLDDAKGKHDKKDYEGINKAVEALAKDFYEKSEKLMDGYLRVFPDLKQIIKYIDMDDYKDLTSVDEMEQKAINYKGKYAFTEKDISAFRKQSKKIHRVDEKHIRHAVKAVEAIMHDKKPKHIGSMSIHKNDSKLAKDMVKADKILGEKEKDFREIHDEINRQLEHNQVGQNFLELMTDYLVDYSEVSSVTMRIRIDVYVLIFHHLKEHDRETQMWNRFHAFFREGYSHTISDRLRHQIDEFYKEDDDGKSIIDNLREYLQNDDRTMRILFKEDRKEEREEKYIDQRIESDKKKLMHQTAA